MSGHQQHCSHHDQRFIFLPHNALKRFGSWALPGPQHSPRLPSWLQGWAPRKGKEGRDRNEGRNGESVSGRKKRGMEAPNF